MDEDIFNLTLECVIILLISIGFYCLKRSRCLMNNAELGEIHNEIISLRNAKNSSGDISLFTFGNKESTKPTPSVVVHTTSPVSSRTRSKTRSRSRSNKQMEDV